jgi:hypothetical protein
MGHPSIPMAISTRSSEHCMGDMLWPVSSSPPHAVPLGQVTLKPDSTISRRPVISSRILTNIPLAVHARSRAHTSHQNHHAAAGPRGCGRLLSVSAH